MSIKDKGGVRIEVTGARGPRGPGGPAGSAYPVYAIRADAMADTNLGERAVFFLAEGGRKGHFIVRTGTAPTDAQQGIYFQLRTGFYAERIWDGVNGKPEWFGAVSGGPDCYTAITACITLCPTTQLEAADYWTSQTIKVMISNRKLVGTGQNYLDAAAQATRILTTSASIDIVQIGPDTFTGSVNTIPRGMAMEDIYVGRTTGPLISSACSGVLIKYALGCNITRVKSVDSINSFRFYGAVACETLNCNANRVVAGTGAGTDSWAGYLVDGTASIGLAGGNGSIYISKCQAGCNISSLQMGLSYGYRLIGGFQDTFLLNTESVACNTGISIEGGAGADADVIITAPILDACFKWGIYAANLSGTGSVNITDPYVGANSSTQFCIYMNNTLAPVNIQGGQLLCANGSGLTAAVALGTATRRVALRGTIISECTVIGVSIGADVSNLHIAPILSNVVAGSGSGAVSCAGAITASYIAPLVSGKVAAYAQGIQVLGTSDARNEYNLTGIDSACIASGSANKLTRNGVQITATGLTGTNLVSGVVT